MDMKHDVIHWYKTWVYYNQFPEGLVRLQNYTIKKQAPMNLQFELMTKYVVGPEQHM